MELILGFSLGFNVLFIGLWIIGWRMDKKIKQTSDKMMQNIFTKDENKNWMYEA